MSRLSHCRHWIFDMDGTLTNAIHDFDSIRSALGMESGVPILEAINAMPKADALSASRALHVMEMEIASQSTAQEGTARTLGELQARGFSLGILTRNAEDIAHETLAAAGLKKFFSSEAIIGREKCAPKPDPEGIYRLLKLWGACKNESVIVGDYVFDLESGRNANITTVHLDVTEKYPWSEMTDVKINRFDLLLDLL